MPCEQIGSVSGATLTASYPTSRLASPLWQDRFSCFLVSGSLRAGSTNTAVLETARMLTPQRVKAVLYRGMGGLPHFNPDDDREGETVHGAVAELREQVESADALLICTPEYAGALPGALKNLLEWTVGDAGTYRKPVAWINASGGRKQQPRPVVPAPCPCMRRSRAGGRS